MTDAELLAARDQAWTAFADFEGYEWHPRHYKKPTKGAKRHINPFSSTEELKQLSEQRRQLYCQWLYLMFEANARSLPPMSTELFNSWRVEQTLDGDRYRKVYISSPS